MNDILIISYNQYKGHKAGLKLIKQELLSREITQPIHLLELKKGASIPERWENLEDGIIISAGEEGFNSLKNLNSSNKKVFFSHKDERFLNEEFKVLDILYLPDHLTISEPTISAYKTFLGSRFIRGKGVPIQNLTKQEIQQEVLQSEEKLSQSILDPSSHITHHVILNLDGDSEDTQIAPKPHYGSTIKNRLFTTDSCRNLIRRLFELKIIHQTTKVYLRCHPTRTGQFSWKYFHENNEIESQGKVTLVENELKGFDSQVYQVACEELDLLGIPYQTYSKEERPTYYSWYAFAERRDVTFLVPAVSTTQVVESFNQGIENLILYETTATSKDHFQLSYSLHCDYGIPFLTDEAYLPKIDRNRPSESWESPEGIIADQIIEILSS